MIGGKKTKLFPENQQDFYDFFIDGKNNSIKNKNKFQNRIFGMISYYGNYYFESQIKQDFPKEF